MASTKIFKIAEVGSGIELEAFINKDYEIVIQLRELGHYPNYNSIALSIDDAMELVKELRKLIKKTVK